MRCPKCNFHQTFESPECVKCGVIFSKYQTVVEAQSRPAPAYPAVHQPQPSIMPPRQTARRNYEFKVGAFGQKLLSINDSFVSLKNKRLASREIEWMKAGSFNFYYNFIKATSNHLLELGTSAEKIKVEMTDALYFKGKRRLFGEILDALWECVGSNIIGNIIKVLETGRRYQIGESVWDARGVVLPKRGFFSISAKERVLVEYSDLELFYANGTVNLRSRTERGVKMSAQLRRVPNACLIGSLYDILVTRQGYRALLEQPQAQGRRW